jgi:hypothetical protein
MRANKPQSLTFFPSSESNATARRVARSAPVTSAVAPSLLLPPLLLPSAFVPVAVAADEVPWILKAMLERIACASSADTAFVGPPLGPLASALGPLLLVATTAVMPE